MLLFGFKHIYAPILLTIMQKEIHYFYLNLKGKKKLFFFLFFIFFIVTLKALFILKEFLLLLNKYDLNGKYIHHGICSTVFHLFYYLL